MKILSSVLIGGLLMFQGPTAPVEVHLYSIDVSHLDRADVRSLRHDPVVAWWTELGDTLVIAAHGVPPTAASAPAKDLGTLAPTEALFIGQRVHPTEVGAMRGVRLLASGGVFTLLAGSDSSVAPLNERDHSRVEPLKPNVAYARSRPMRDPAFVARPSPALASIADAIDVQRWHDTVRDLAAFNTRYIGTSGLDSARDYIATQFSQLGLLVSTPQFQVQGVAAQNVVGELQGSTDSTDVYIVCGHYDSISEMPTSLAPGAEDNGSGAAGVIEIARAFVANPPPFTVRFIAFSGEEEGLVGSSRYVESLLANGEASHIKGVINMDMIGFSEDDDLDVLLETNTNSPTVLNALSEAAATYTSMRVVTSFNPFGSDHVPFLRQNIPTVLTIQNDWDTYPDYHRSTDRLANVRNDMGGQILRMNAAALGILMGLDGGDFTISRARFKSGNGTKLVLDGRFAFEGSQVFVNETALASTMTKTKFITGSTTRRLIASDPELKALIPKGVTVQITVVDPTTGTVTSAFAFTR